MKTLKGTDDISRGLLRTPGTILPAKCRLSPLAPILLLLLCLLASCGSPSDGSPVKVIVGAQLDPGRGQPRLEHSVLVIRDGKFQAVGPQASTPVPKGAQITSGMGKLVTPAPGSANVIRVIAAGEPANLVLRDAATQSAEMTMHDGEWLK